MIAEEKRPEIQQFQKDLDFLFLKMMFAKPVPFYDAPVNKYGQLRERNGLQQDTPDLAQFDGADLWLDSALDIRNGNGVFMDGKPSDIDKELDVKTISSGVAGEEVIQFTRVRLERPSRKWPQARGEVIAILTVAHLDKLDRLRGDVSALGYAGRSGGYGKWVRYDWDCSVVGKYDPYDGFQVVGGWHPEKDTSWQDGVINGAIGRQFNSRYEWSVHIGLGNMPRVRFATDPEGVRSVFKFRDKMSDEQRRAALLHWVSKHWRQTRPGDPSKAVIEAYLRGKTDFHWGGMSCSITPSPYDLEQYHKGKVK